MALEVKISVGDLYTSYPDFHEQLQYYKDRNLVEFYISDSRTLDAASKRYPNRVRNVNRELQYYTMKYRCVHGGVFSKSKNTIGVRLREKISQKQDCGAFISLRVSSNGQNLEVYNMSEVHNHEVSELLYKQLPQKRNKPNPSIKLETMEKKADKMAIQENMLKDTGNTEKPEDTKQTCNNNSPDVEEDDTMILSDYYEGIITYGMKEELIDNENEITPPKHENSKLGKTEKCKDFKQKQNHSTLDLEEELLIYDGYYEGLVTYGMKEELIDNEEEVTNVKMVASDSTACLEDSHLDKSLDLVTEVLHESKQTVIEKNSKLVCEQGLERQEDGIEGDDTFVQKEELFGKTIEISSLIQEDERPDEPLEITMEELSDESSDEVELVKIIPEDSSSDSEEESKEPSLEKTTDEAESSSHTETTVMDSMEMSIEEDEDTAELEEDWDCKLLQQFEVVYDDEDNKTGANVEDSDTSPTMPQAFAVSTNGTQVPRLPPSVQLQCIRVPNKNNATSTMLNVMPKTANLSTTINTNYRRASCGVIHPVNSNLLYRCQKCQICYKELFSLKRHIAQHHKEYKEIAVYTCNTCQRVFGSEGHLKQHEVVHNKSIITYSQCQLCNRFFESESKLEHHINTTHSDKLTYKCIYCQKMFTAISEFRLHIHICKKSVKCKLCDMRFTVKSNLIAHMRKHDRGMLRGYPCNSCPQVYYRKWKLDQHSLKCNNNQ